VGPEEVWIGSRRNFVILAHRASTDGSFNINDLCGSAGRLDGILRCINSPLFLSHGMRRDTSIHIVMLGPSDPPKVLTVNGQHVKYLNPDERSTAALVKKALEIPLGREEHLIFRSTPGITIARGGLATFLGTIEGRILLLDEGGMDPAGPGFDPSLLCDGTPLYFFLSDDRDLTLEESAAIRSRSCGAICLSPLVLHADHAITLMHNILDRSRKSPISGEGDIVAQDS